MNSNKFAIITLLCWLSFVHYSIRSGVADVRHMLNLKMKVGLGTGKHIEHVSKCVGTVTWWIHYSQLSTILTSLVSVWESERSLTKPDWLGRWEVSENGPANKSELGMLLIQVKIGVVLLLMCWLKSSVFLFRAVRIWYTPFNTPFYFNSLVILIVSLIF